MDQDIDVTGEHAVEGVEFETSATVAPAANAAEISAPPTAAPSFVYALGRVSPRFPSLGVEKEFAQATGRTDRSPDLNDRETIESVLSQNRYIARQMCWPSRTCLGKWLQVTNDWIRDADQPAEEARA